VTDSGNNLAGIVHGFNGILQDRIVDSVRAASMSTRKVEAVEIAGQDDVFYFFRVTKHVHGVGIHQEFFGRVGKKVSTE
jgi:hypothetical protein